MRHFMKISKFLCAAFVSAALTGCCGTHLSTEEVHQFNLNQDTEAVVKAKLGEPWQTFYSVDIDEVNKAISGLREIKATDYIHRIGVYTFSFSPLLSHNNAYFELNMFIYRPDGVLQDVAEYTCYTQQSCEDILEAEKQKYAVEDLDRLVEDAKKLMNKKQKQLLAEKKKKADAERKRRLAAAQAAKVQKKSEPKGTTVQKVIRSSDQTAPSSGTSAPANSQQQNATVRKNISL